ncbi:glucose/galactose MFS transporter [Gluconobacter sphaericus]|uniref:Glucose/galactose MFS transporter n=1 Tax=Gluconobacter sphaericus NBRC 12467 TaxID=1307951 RepID=A0AA37SHD3_9PROT|nr:glucose/galactose MFS transporter [Gluconobacter sphaericus]MBF0886837.1 glucose/galactose MFS transporter [Gluconobacter sphaericus]MBS1087005.1 glucose/galactose MFS transporter [Gluconobacter sphaericus]MBS1098616.1 glucose/galactose MFS transporter [Gluconobacter sphaericus]MBS1100973.1 glucose/galactose MFS transporter [Gluconobacter sphaericus]GBR55796.1 glucose/galactose transporter [Gluconobacter sphaericus NBRC 12467]
MALPKSLSHSSLTAPYGLGPLGVAAGIFFMMGFVTWLNGPLISFVRVAFSLGDVAAFMVPMVFYISYFIFSIPASFLARSLGLRKGLSVALLLCALGVATFGQFVSMRIYGGALTGLLILGAGLSLMQVVVNPLVSLLGPSDRAAQRIAVMGVCNKFAGILAPIVLATVVMGDIDHVAQSASAAPDAAARNAVLNTFVHAIYTPYMGMALLLLVAAVTVVFCPLPNLQAPLIPGMPDSGTRIFRPHLVFGILTMFLYVGVEVMAGDAIGTYGQQFGFPLSQTKFFTSFTLGAMLFGYLLGFAIIPRIITQERFLELSCIAGIILTLMAFLTTGYVSVACVALLGAANAMMMPTIFPIAIRGAGPWTPLASALLVMTYSGGAIIPQIYVALKPLIGFQAMFALLVIPSYFAVFFYARRYGQTGLLPLDQTP